MNNHSRVLSILLIAAFALGEITACTTSSVEFEAVYWPTQGWKNALPEEQGMDSAQLARMFEYIEKNDIRLHSLFELKIGLDGLYRLTETSKGRPTGLRGRWSESDTFFLDYIVFGDSIRSAAQIQFDGNKITLTINYLNWNSPPIILHGKMQE